MFGNQISKISNIIKESDEFDIYYKLNKHTVVVSSNSFRVVTNFLADYFSKLPNSQVLIIGEPEMGKTMKPLLDLMYLEGKLFFLSFGKGFDLKTIKKACLDN